MPVPASPRSGNNTEKKDHRLELADRLIEQIEQGTARWQRPWKAGEILAPVNAVTGKPYRGVNYENLMALSPDPSDPRWCTYKQAQEQGWQVRQGASGLPLEVWKEYEHKRTEEEIQRLEKQGVTDPEPTERRLGVRYYTVFHASQMDGIPPLERQEPDLKLEGKPDVRLPKLAERLGVELRYGGGRAFYRPSEDRVQMPPVESFEQAVGHDTTLLHELSHATGHERRLNRDLKNSFGSEKYAIEELRAEMSAAMTAASLGIGFDPASQDLEEGREMGNSAAYLASWLKALPEKERKQILMQAIKDAQGISDYLIERTPELQVEQERPALSRGDYVRYRNEIGQEVEGVVLDAAQAGEATRLRRIYRWPNGTPGLDGADHIVPTVLPNDLVEHIPGAGTPGPDLDAIDPQTDAYQRTMGMDDSRDRAGRAVLMAVETARGQSERAAALQAAALQAAALPERALDPELIAFLENRTRVRQGEHPNFAGLSDPVANAEAFVERQGSTDPQRSAQWARALQESPVAYGEAVGVSPATAGLVATQLNAGVQRMERPQVGDLVRFEPHEPGVTSSPFSGRIIAALDTSGGDIRYHLRAETGPDQGMEARVYGRDGEFREIALEQAVGFDRALAPEAEKAPQMKEQALQEYQAFYAQLPQREEKLVTAVRERSERLAPADFRGFSDMMRDFRTGVDDTFGILREGENRGASAPELRLAQAFTPEEIPDLPAVQTARDQARRLGERFHDLDREIRDVFKARLREHGKALLESGSLRDPREIAQATYWKHGIEASPDSPMIGKVVGAIQDKDLKTLLGMIGHNSQNPGSEEVFTHITGVKLGKTQKERVAQLLEWAGPEKAQALRESNALAEREREARGLRDGVVGAWADLKGLRVDVGGQVVNGQEYVTLKVAGGQDRIASGKEGAATTYHLVNDRGEYSRVKDVRFTAFAKRVLAMDADGMVRNALEKAGIVQGIAPEGVTPKPAADLQKEQKAPEAPRKNAYEQKIEARKERYLALSEKTRARAKARMEQARRMADAIPFGQPILVGHHSEKRDRKFRERIHQNFGKGFDLLEKAAYYERRAKGVNDYAISADDPDAVKKLRERVENLKSSQERMKAANAAIRKHQKDGPEAQQAALEHLGFQPDRAKAILTPDVMGTVGFASYSLSNNNANIRRLEERIQILEKAQALEDRETPYAWGTVRENREINRIQFRFEDKPDEEVRNLMKSSGFRWAPSEGAWQRQWTGNAVYAARDVIKKLDALMPPEQVATLQAAAAPDSAPRLDNAPAPKGHAVNPSDAIRDPGAALVAAIKDRDGDWYHLSVQENDGRLVGTLQRRDAETGLVETMPAGVFQPDVNYRVVARFERESGELLAVGLSRGRDGGVELKVFSESRDAAVFAWQRIHEYPGHLRANEALQKIPDHREGKVIEQALGVDPKMLNPAREAHRVPARRPEKRKQQGVEI
ncbi:DUF3560 domain-containing protein [Acidithiobacillus sp. 'AMD consortium']|uniref:DUF3560 domain-containing protein n=2 Tax=Acidithiobacillus ferrooxidans TaxID=920 RepID=A0A2W1K3P5_ACIFR|nr:MULTISPECIES: DUF3560 domain-containing protein [Acidithiobacillus]ACH83540.1 domain of unknown function DUF1738 [Acidithiobacillus ferrooxidans ATCC 53993]MBU2772369.1 DUF3560 domain-containing protein [Acidithiobacillus ferrooxidans]MCR1342212.1 DUF3560 domain-containing protein [Acidithiobacillus ferrooxidans]PZD81243.1 DUF3560 domain-containing protein [Acidithiobacillus ferrooxidans]QFG78360.1 DUF3560 domain-containing protein [Acidithiobacillus sp. 'AMD consortium']